MSYLLNNQVGFAVPYADASFRLRASTPLTLFEHNNQYGTNPYKWDTQVSGTGSITDTNSSSSTSLSTGGTASGASAIRQSRAYYRYQVEKSFLVGHAFNFGAGVTGVSKKIGYYDANNGVYIEQNGTTINIGFRQAGVDTRIPQASWNVDTMNGAGPSGQTFNPADTQAVAFDMLGTLSVRIYLLMNNNMYLVHQYSASNISGAYGPYTANLTSRADIVNTTTVASASTMIIGNVNIVSEGATEESAAYNFAAGNGVTTLAVTTRRPIFSIRANTTGPNRTIQNFGQIIAKSLNVYASASVYYELVVNGTLTGATFAALNANSVAMTDVAATALSGGTTVSSGYIAVASGGGPGVTNDLSISNALSLYFPIVYSSLLNTQDTLSIVCTSFTGSANCAGSLSWTELY